MPGIKPNGLTVFDLDHTLLKVNSSYQFGCFLFKKKYLSLLGLIRCFTYYASHKFLGMSLEKVHHKVFEHLFKNRSSLVVEKYVESFLDQNLSGMIAEKTLNRLLEAQKNGNYTLLLSSSPDFLVEPIAKKLKVHAYQASLYEKDKKGLYVRVGHVLNGAGKAQYMHTMTQRLKLGQAQVTVYSDSYLDLPILEMAGKAVGVNPDSSLRKLCLKRGWEIL